MKQEPTAGVLLERVADLVDGFETPYGMELLASVHWAAIHENEDSDAESAVSAMTRWNERKRRLFKPAHIRLAWERLQAEGWVKALGAAGR